jgi:hypothetical protein
MAYATKLYTDAGVGDKEIVQNRVEDLEEKEQEKQAYREEEEVAV